jgi:hypothetical protein
MEKLRSSVWLPLYPLQTSWWCLRAGAGVLFGNTGGVMEAAVRTVYEVVTGKVNLAALLSD